MKGSSGPLPRPPVNDPPQESAVFFDAEFDDGQPSTSDSSSKQTRSYFPETWLWQFVFISLVHFTSLFKHE